MKDRDPKAEVARRTKGRAIRDDLRDQRNNKPACTVAATLAALGKTFIAKNVDQQEKQIEVLWNALKILRADAGWHMNGGSPLETEDYAIWAGRAWAAYDLVHRLINQRVRLLVHSLQCGRPVEVGNLEALEADYRDGSSGPYFTAERRERLLNAKALKCDGLACASDPWHRHGGTLAPAKKNRKILKIRKAVK